MTRALCLGATLAVAAASALAEAPRKPAPRVTDSEPRIVGALDVKAVRASLHGRRRVFLDCYRKGLAKQADLEGDEIIAFTIGRDGKVTAIQAAGMGTPVDECVTATIQKLRFARPRDGKPVEVTHVLSFASGEPAPALSGLGSASPSPGGNSLGLGTAGRLGDGGLGSGFSGPPTAGKPRPASPVVKLGSPVVTGKLDASLVRRVIRANQARLRYCYEKELVASPTLTGTVQLDFTITASGTVAGATASGLGNANVEACMTKALASLSFPRPHAGDVTVRLVVTVSPSA